jgi:hypothetical protein
MPLDALFDLLAYVFGAAVGKIGSAIERSEIVRTHGDRLRELREQIAACPLVPIAAADGPAALEGVARPLATVEAPLSGRAVIGYRLRLDGVFQDGEDRATRELLDVSLVREFELVERTGQVARIRPDRCLPLLVPEPVVTLELASVIKPPLAPIIDRALISPSDLVTAYELHAVEHLLEPGEPVFAYGVAERALEAGTEVGYRETPWRVELSAPEGGVLILADQHRDALLTALEEQPELLPSL